MQFHSITIDIATELSEIAPIWEEFSLTAISSPYQRIDWIDAQLRILGHFENVEPCFVLVYRTDTSPDKQAGEKTLVAALPLCIKTGRGVRILQWIGDTHSNQMGGIFDAGFAQALDKNGFQALWDQIVDALPPHDLIWLSAQTATLAGIPNPISYLDHEVPSAHTCRMVMFAHHDWKKLLPALRSKKARKMMRNKENRLCSLADIGWRFLQSEDEIAALLPELFNQRRQRFEELGIAAETNEQEYVSLYQDMLNRSLKKGDKLTRMLILTADGEMIAGMVLFQWKGGLYPLLISMTSNPLRQWSPGDFILRLALEYACSEKLDFVDMGAGDQKYKTAWCNHEVPMFETVLGSTLKGRFAASLIRLALSSKKTIKTNPKLWNAYTRLRSFKANLTKSHDTNE